MTDRLIIRDIGFIGPSKRATLPLQDGLNVLWGASNTGKSFFVKSMDFMFGAGSDRLPGIRERDRLAVCGYFLNCITGCYLRESIQAADGHS